MARFFTATHNGVIPGITLDKSGNVTLGEQGRQRREVTIQVRPGALVRDGRVIAGSFDGRTIGPVDPSAPDAVIIRVNTAGTYTRGAPGRLALGPGCMELVRGTCAWGDAGGLGTMPDALVGVRKGPAVAFVTFSGGRHKGRGLRLLAVVEGADGLDPVIADLPPEGDVALRPELDGTVTLGLHLRDLPAVAPTGDAADLARLTRLVDIMRSRATSATW